MLTIVYWLWKDDRLLLHKDGPRPRVYLAEHVNAQLPMLRKYMVGSYRVVCVTDDPTGLDPSIEVVPMPCGDLDYIDGQVRFPSCTRKLWMFSKEAARVIGGRVLCLDVDGVIVGSMQRIVDRSDTFVGLEDGNGGFGGGAYLLDTGALTTVWELLPSPQDLKERGIPRTDQGWMTHILKETGFPKFGNEVMIARTNRPLPPDASVVMIATAQKPWMPECLEYYPWVADRYPVREASCPST